MLSLLGILHSPPNTSLKAREQTTGFFTNRIKGEQVLFCMTLQKYKALHYHIISAVSSPEEEPGDRQNCRQNIPGLPPAPLTLTNNPVCTYLSLCRGTSFSEQCQARNFWLTACVKAPATCLVLHCCSPRQDSSIQQAHRSSHWHTAGQLHQTVNIIAERRESV